MKNITAAKELAVLGEGAPAPSGLRQRNKDAKLRSIREAARKLFASRGYHATPLREVARVADVGFGTISAYASDKGGLLAMIFLEDLQDFPPVFGTVEPNSPLVDQLMRGFRRMFSFWARDPELSLTMLKQLESRESNVYAAAILERRAQIRRELTAWLRAGQAARRIRPNIDPEQAEETIFALYTSTVREWLVLNPSNAESGLAKLRYRLELPLAALSRDAPAGIRTRSNKKRSTGI